MRLLLLLAALVPLRAAEEPREVVRRAVELDRHNAALARDYTYIERADQRQYDGSGKIKKLDLRTFDVTLLEGSPYRRLIARNDKPLSPEEVRQEEDKLQHNIEQRRNETPQQRAKRLADYEQRLKKQRDPAREVPDAFNFKVTREVVIDGRDVWEIEATPKPGYKSKSSGARFFPKVRGTLWIDKTNYQWVKAEMESMDTISLGAFLLRLAKGSRIAVEQTFVNNEIWLPRHVEMNANARILLLKSLRATADITYSQYRKFTVDSRVVETHAP